MPQSLTNILVHIIFSTKHRQPFIDPKIEPELYPFLVDICSSRKMYMHNIGGTADHLHLLVSLSRTVAISTFVEDLKKNSSRWIKTKGLNYQNFAWQRGYGGFSVSASQQHIVAKYISNQKEHHKKMSFQDEYRTFLTKNNIEFDEQYVWD